MTIKELVFRNRSVRRFKQGVSISEAMLREWVDLGRLSGSAGNRQLLRFVLSANPVLNEKIFPCLAWAGYLTNWAGPVEGERPSAYIVIVAETELIKGCICDHGIAAQSILLGAVESGFGGCMIGSIKREQLSEVLGLPAKYEILLVIALGEPAETVIVEPVVNGDIKYWRDEQGRHHVPKYSLEEILLHGDR